MKLQKFYLGICLACLCFVQGVFAQLSNGEGITPIEGVVNPKSHTSELEVVKPGAVLKDCDYCPEMVLIPAGSFLMGSPTTGEDAFSNSKPQHRVNIQSFAIGKYEVTQEQWYSVMGNNPSKNRGRTLPVENISWDDAQLFVQKLSQKTGVKYRLPSEAEWEYAARAGTTTQYFWGDDVNQAKDYSWYSGNSFRNSQLVGSKKPNRFGLFDMVGNVWEWTQDCFNKYSSNAPTYQRPWISGDCSWRVLRGGSWSSEVFFLHSAFRDSSSVGGNYSDNGLRIARDF